MISHPAIPFGDALERAGMDCDIRCLHEGDRLATDGDEVELVVKKFGRYLYRECLPKGELGVRMVFLTVLVEGGVLS